MNIIDELLKDHELYHSDYQIENFIIGSQGHIFFRYKQCLREIKGRMEKLQNARESLELMDIPTFRSIISKLDPISKRRKIRRERRMRSRKALVEDIRETDRELKKFVELAQQLKNQIGEIDQLKRRKMESTAWTDKARRMAALDIFISGNLSHQTMDFILKLSAEDQKTILLGFDGKDRNQLLEILSGGP